MRLPALQDVFHPTGSLLGLRKARKDYNQLDEVTETILPRVINGLSNEEAAGWLARNGWWNA